jgi:polyhydroxybutyrate depolymerase
MDYGGRTRSYLYHLPPETSGQPDQKRPLIVALHGRYGDGVSQEKLATFTHIADRGEAIIVYPDGVEKSWNDYREKGPAADLKVDDIGFIRALIDRFIADHGADPKRVYVTGMSNGAMMSYVAACELADKVAAVGTVAGLFPLNATDRCKPSRPMPMMIVAGTHDKLMPYDGGDVADDRGTVMSAAQTRDYFATKNRCGNPAPSRYQDPADDDTRARWEESTSGCKENAEVILLTIENGGHTWPGGWQYLGEWAVGKTSRDVDASEELWKFFQRHALP